MFILRQFPVDTVVTQSPLLLENADAVSGRVPGSPPAHWCPPTQSGPPSRVSPPLPRVWTCLPGPPASAPSTGLCPRSLDACGYLPQPVPPATQARQAQHRARGGAFVTAPASVSVSEPCDTDSVALTGMLSVRTWDPGRAVAPAGALIDHCPHPCWAVTSGVPHDLCPQPPGGVPAGLTSVVSPSDTDCLGPWGRFHMCSRCLWT